MKKTTFSRRNFLAAATVAAAGADTLSAQGAANASAKPKRPNVIFFITDDMFPHHFNFMPNVKRTCLTPTIERLAKEGTVFPNQEAVVVAAGQGLGEKRGPDLFGGVQGHGAVTGAVAGAGPAGSRSATQHSRGCASDRLEGGSGRTDQPFAG